MMVYQSDMFCVDQQRPGNRLDERCSTCAFRVFERSAIDTMSMNCLHPAVGRFCKDERTETQGRCGTEALLWTPRARG